MFSAPPDAGELTEEQTEYLDRLRQINMNTLTASPAVRAGNEVWYFAGRLDHIEKLRSREGFDMAGNFGGWVGTGVPISPEPDTPFLADATHEAEILIPAGNVAAQARSHVVNGKRMYIVTGALLVAQGVVLGAVRELKQGKK